MADEANKPLLDRGSRSPSPHRSSSARNLSPSQSRDAHSFELSSESTPLLIRRDNELAYGILEPRPMTASSRASSHNQHLPHKEKERVRWPIVFPVAILAAVLLVLVFAFVAPAVVKRYVTEAMTFHPTDISVNSATGDGVRTRVQGDLVLDANRVKRSSVRNLGRFSTWIAREVETGQSEVKVYLPEYGNILIGTASLPSMTVNIRNGHTNHLDFVTDLNTGDIHGIRGVALDWLEGRLGRLRIKGSTTLHLKSGLLSLGEQTIADDFTLEEKDFPARPQANITHIDVHDVETSTQKGLAADASLSAWIDSPFNIKIPALGFDVLVPNCQPNEPYISVADAKTQEVQVQPGHATKMSVGGFIGGLSDQLTTTCPGQKSSPLDFLVKSYMHGQKTTIYVRGANTPSLHTPAWMVDLLKSVTIPLPFTGHALDNLVKNFTTEDVHFSLPNPLAQPGTPEAQPKVSAVMKVLVGVPKQMKFNVRIPRVRANADVYYEGKQLGVLELADWQPANSSLVNDTNGSPELFVEFAMKDAPLKVTDSNVLTAVLQSLIFGGKPVELHLAAAVDAEIQTGLGRFAIRGIPAEGNVTVKSPFGGSFDQLLPQVESVKIGSTTENSMLLNTSVNFTNPTQYSATVPLVDFALLYNATTIAHITARDVLIVPGLNSGIHVDFMWNPTESGGHNGKIAGREMISHYISGDNTTVTVRTHRGTIPAIPELGEALSKLGLEVQMPKVPGPGNGDRPSHFIQETTLHVLSMTTEFILYSPLPKSNIEITSVEATAYYDEDEAIGSIDYQLPFLVPPGLSPTPPLPVDLILSGVGYDAILKALGGMLDLNAVADIGVRIENYKDTIHYTGRGIAAKIRMI